LQLQWINGWSHNGHNEKDGGMYILLECTADIKHKWLKKDARKHLMTRNLNTMEKIIDAQILMHSLGAYFLQKVSCRYNLSVTSIPSRRWLLNKHYFMASFQFSVFHTCVYHRYLISMACTYGKIEIFLNFIFSTNDLNKYTALNHTEN
jgi:hypothetical protein